MNAGTGPTAGRLGQIKDVLFFLVKRKPSATCLPGFIKIPALI